MTATLRSIAFRASYWLASAFFAITALPLLLIPHRGPLMAWIQAYTRVMVWSMRHIGGIRVHVAGRENLPDGPCIIAAKHQSWGDGFVMFAHVPDLAFVTGDHLMRYPLLGPILKKMGAIVVDNCGGAAARGRLVASELEKAKSAGRSILIYPEGHLSPVGTQHRYRKGVFHLYEKYGVPVVPVATDLGLRWPQQEKKLHPGPCSVEFLPAIAPGLEKGEFMEMLEGKIESRSRALLHEQAFNGTWPHARSASLGGVN
ncbi:lysophospholipid acyltransferase family protein [Parvularcula marina]|uniref:lysophospholipid acyltransferase family protein n=1 Tax=Parvularcula marina TaxID=2292771 RepID=UPI0035160D13